ncbi:MAG TPA: LysM domain-containing protein [Ktedonobacteraceae bacterium]|nr:LysM domain-containing protein [Ktedonobacteraceae bacterium]
MFGRGSRYYALDNAVYRDQDEHAIVYKQRRFLPQGSALPLLSVITANAGDRLDLVAARTLGVSDQFWRICDANNAMNPFDLLDEADGSLRIAQLQFQDVSS